jgi:hypothetical protein
MCSEYPIFPLPMIDNKNKMHKVQYFGIAHGFAGTLIVLSKIHKSQLLNNRCKELINKVHLKLIKHSKVDSEVVFPFYNTNQKDYLYYNYAWCHGDFSVGYAIYFSGYLLNNNEYKEFGLKVIDRSLEVESTYIYEIKWNMFCHGKIRLAHMYRRLYEMTDELKYKKASIRWYNLIDHDNPDFKNEFIDSNSGLLLGYEGYLLSKLSFISNFEPKWDKCLLLS